MTGSMSSKGTSKVGGGSGATDSALSEAGRAMKAVRIDMTRNGHRAHSEALYGESVRAIYPTNGGHQGARRLAFAVGGAVRGLSGQECFG